MLAESVRLCGAVVFGPLLVAAPLSLLASSPIGSLVLAVVVAVLVLGRSAGLYRVARRSSCSECGEGRTHVGTFEIQTPPVECVSCVVTASAGTA